jgi:hypothetical protein
VATILFLDVLDVCLVFSFGIVDPGSAYNDCKFEVQSLRKHNYNFATYWRG